MDLTKVIANLRSTVLQIDAVILALQHALGPQKKRRSSSKAMCRKRRPPAYPH